jgi:hypothetical protein
LTTWDHWGPEVITAVTRLLRRAIMAAAQWLVPAGTLATVTQFVKGIIQMLLPTKRQIVVKFIIVGCRSLPIPTKLYFFALLVVKN